jgi:acyl-coenzyme A thioesterase PaaI-like protein
MPIPPGHAAGDLLRAPEWEVLEEGPGYLRLDVHLPDHVRNPRGQLFGGFTGTYVDLVALTTVYAGGIGPRVWMATTNMRIDYLAPVEGPRFLIESRLTASRGRNRFVDVRFMGHGDDEPTVLATATMRQNPDLPYMADAEAAHIRARAGSGGRADGNP